MKPNLDHIVLFIKNLKKTEQFYNKFLGRYISKNKYQITYQVDNTFLFFALPYKKKPIKYNKEDYGLNHIAFGIKNVKELEKIKILLNNNKIKNSGIKIDKYGKKPFIWLDDPNGIRLEFYLRK